MRENKFLIIFLRKHLEKGLTIQEAKEIYLAKNNTILTDRGVEVQLKKYCIQNRHNKKFYLIN